MHGQTQMMGGDMTSMSRNGNAGNGNMTSMSRASNGLPVIPVSSTPVA